MGVVVGVNYCVVSVRVEVLPTRPLDRPPPVEQQVRHDPARLRTGSRNEESAYTYRTVFRRMSRDGFRVEEEDYGARILFRVLFALYRAGRGCLGSPEALLSLTSRRFAAE